MDAHGILSGQPAQLKPLPHPFEPDAPHDADVAEPPTDGMDICLSTFAEPHEGHAGCGASLRKTNFSKRTPQSLQRYS